MTSLTIYNRELKSYFSQPTAYAIIVIFLILSLGFTFTFGNFMRVGDASLEYSFFFWHPWLYMLIAPAVGMKLWADEQRTGTIELLGTFPVSTWSAIVGKFFAASTVTLVALIAHISHRHYGELSRQPRQWSDNLRLHWIVSCLLHFPWRSRCLSPPARAIRWSASSFRSPYAPSWFFAAMMISRGSWPKPPHPLRSKPSYPSGSGTTSAPSTAAFSAYRTSFGSPASSAFVSSAHPRSSMRSVRNRFSIEVPKSEFIVS